MTAFIVNHKDDKNERRKELKIIMEKTIEEVIYEETEKRIAEMQSPDYVFPKRLDHRDIVVILASMGISGLLLLLCMVGVIA